MKQINVFILIILLLSCNVKKKNDIPNNVFFIAEAKFNNYNTYEAIHYYQQYLSSTKSENYILSFKVYCRLSQCYYRISEKKKLELTSKIVDSLYKNFGFLKEFKYDYFLVCALNQHIQRNYKNAANYFQNALEILPQDDTLTSLLYYKLGVCYEKLNKLDTAELYYKKALNIARQKKDYYSNELANCYNVMAYLYSIKYSDFYTSKLFYDSVLYISANCHNLDSISYAWNLLNIGNFYHYQGLYSRAEFYYNQSYNIYSFIKYWKDESIKLLYFQSNLYGYFKKLDLAQNKIEMAISYYLKNNIPEDLLESYYQKAYIYYIANDYNQAFFYYKKAHEICIKYKLPDEERILNCIGRCFLKNNLPDSAKIYFNKTIGLLNMQKFKSINTFVSIYGEYSRMLINERQYNEALQLIESRIPYVLQVLGEKNSQFGYFIYWKALALEHLNNLPASLNIYQDMINASVYPDLKNSVYDVPLFKATDIISHDNLIDAITGKADVLAKMAMQAEYRKQKTFLLQKSLEHYAKAREVVEYYNKQIGSESNRLQFTSSESSVYKKELTASIRLFRNTGQQHYLEKAFLCADHGKAIQISLGLKDDEYKQIGGVPDSLTQKERKLHEEIALLQSSIHSENNTSHPDPAHLDLWRNKLSRNTNESEKLSMQIDEKYPRYYQLKYSGNNIDIKSLKSQIGINKTLIEYAFEGDSLYTFILSGNQVKVQSQPSSGIEDSIVSFINCINEINNPKTFTIKGISRYINEAYQLYTRLIKPIEKYLSRQIVIISDGMINLLPMESLVTSDSIPAHADYGLLRYLLYKYSISYSYSAGLFAIQQKIGKAGANKVSAFAPVYENVLSGLKNKVSGDSVSELLSSKDEVFKIVGIFGGKAFVGKKATKTNFKQQISKGNVLHLAMHTILDNEYPMNSRLVFYKDGESDSNNLLNTYEIYNLKINSPLVVLSGCNTGNGKLVKGEGIISLSRGFIYAGCPSMVTTLWNVADINSSRLMQLFYKNLKANLNIDKSLQNAKIEYVENSSYTDSHPYYWAGYIQTGKTESVLIASKKCNKLIVIALCLLIITGITIYYARIKFFHKD